MRIFEDFFECASAMHHNGAQRMDAAKSDFFALLASSDTDVFSKRRELTKNKRLDLEVFI